jgi:RNA polymerase sigma-70 factor (ECF subfamily)
LSNIIGSVLLWRYSDTVPLLKHDGRKWWLFVVYLNLIFYGRSLELNEQNLLESARQGDHDAFKEFIKKYEHKVARIVMSMLGDCAEAEDVGQETFIQFYKNMNKFRGESSPGTYLTRIAINLSLNEIKRRKKKKKFHIMESSASSDENIIEQLPAPHSESNEHELKEIIHKGINRLHEKYRAVIVLRLIEGYSTRETAKILNLPQGTVLSRLSRAQKRLKVILQPIIGGSYEQKA